MKKLYFTVLVFLSALTIQSQPWAQPGAHWYYKDGDDVPIGYSGYIEITKIGDTLITGILCDVLTCHHVGISWWNGSHYDYYLPNQYTYIGNDTVYNWKNNQFYPLYVFSTQPTDYWITGPGYYGTGCQGDTIKINAYDVVNVNGINMRRLAPRPYDSIPFPQDRPSIYLHDTIYERFGCLAFLFPVDACVTDIAVPLLRCYSDNSGFSFSTNIAPYCDYIFTGINENNFSLQLTLSPNPANTSFTLSINSTTNEVTEIHIYNMLGSQVYFSKEETASGKFSKEINVENFSNGIYFLQLKTKEGVVSKKVVVQH